jgi:hypothetical protein
MEDLLEHSDEIMSQVNDNPVELTAYEILLVYRRHVISSLTNPLHQNDTRWPDFLSNLLLVQKEHNSKIFEESKAALTQAFVFYASSWDGSNFAPVSRIFDRTYLHKSLMTDFSQVVEKYYDVHTDDLKKGLEIIESGIYTIATRGHASTVTFTPTLLTHLKIREILTRLARFWSDRERFNIMQWLLDVFVRNVGYRRSTPFYIQEFIGCLYSSSEGLCTRFFLPKLPAFLIRIGYEIQSDVVANVIKEYIERFTDEARMFCCAVLEHKELWTASTLTIFEATIMSGLVNRSPQLSNKLALKLPTCDTDMPSLRAVLLLRPDEANLVLYNATRQYIERFTHPMERILKDIDSKVQWNLVADFIRSSDALNPEKWFGMICKRDTEGLLPEGIAAVTALLDKDRSLVNKRFLGWLARSMSRLTRRFSEDPVLSQPTLKAVRDLGT